MTAKTLDQKAAEKEIASYFSPFTSSQVKSVHFLPYNASILCIFPGWLIKFVTLSDKLDKLALKYTQYGMNISLMLLVAFHTYQTG